MRSVMFFLITTAHLTVAGIALGLPQPLLHYTFDEASSGTTAVLDHGSGTPFDGTFVGNATRTNNTPAGFSQGALNVSMPVGTSPNNNNYVSGGDISKLNGLTNLTITTWINLRTSPLVLDRILSCGSSLANGLDLYTGNSATALKLTQRIGATSTAFTNAINASLKWVFIAVTWDGLTCNLYQGGEEFEDDVVQLASVAQASMTISSASDFRVSSTARAPTTDRTPPAWIDDVRIYGTALSTSDLNLIRHQNIPYKGTVYSIR